MYQSENGKQKSQHKTIRHVTVIKFLAEIVQCYYYVLSYNIVK